MSQSVWINKFVLQHFVNMADWSDEKCVILRFGDVQWPPRLPDLTAYDFFVWGYLKEKVYQSKPKTLVELKENIEREISLISLEKLSKVMNNLAVRMGNALKKRRSFKGHYFQKK